MFPYIVVIILTTFFSFLAQKTINRSKVYFVLFSLFVLLIPSLFAAFRNLSVGYDVLVYEEYCFRLAKASSSIIDFISLSHLESFFVFVNYISSFLSESIFLALFLIELIIVFFAYVAIVRVRDFAPMWIMMVLFMLGYYNLSFNLMRQCIAISYMMFAYTFLLKDKSLSNFFLVSLAALVMHKTSIVPILGYSYVYISANSNHRKLFSVLLILLLLLVLIAFRYILETIANINPSFEKFVKYGGGEGDNFKGGFKPMLFTILWVGDLICIFLFFIAKRFKLLDNYYLYSYFMLLLIDIFCQLMGFYTGYATRLGMYFSSMHFFYLPMLIMSDKISLFSKRTLSILLIIFFIFIWLKLLSSTGNTIPYNSDLLGI